MVAWRHVLVVLLCLGTAVAQEIGKRPSVEAADKQAIDEKIRKLNEEIQQLQLLRNGEARQLSEVEAENEEAAGESKGGEEPKEGSEGEGGKGEGGEGEGGEGESEGEAEGEGEGEGEEEEEEEPFTPMDLTCGICLLCFITFNMTLYYLVNWPDPDMRVYVWTVISTTISIFVAIFIFSCTDLLLKVVLDKFVKGDSELKTTLLGFGQFFFWFFFMQATVAYVSGVMDAHPFTNDKLIKDQKTDRSILFQSVATLLAHVTGFAAINAGGCLQHMYPFDVNAYTRYGVPLVMWILMLVLGRTVKVLRSSIKDRIEAKRKSPSYSSLSSGTVGGEQEEELISWCLEQWEEETYEVELDVAGLAVSFVLVQAVRFSITGNMPNNLGIEEEDFMHPSSSSLLLLGVGFLFAIITVLCVVAHFMWSQKYPVIRSGSFESTVKRMILTGRMSFAMAFAWCLFTASKWEITRLLPQFGPNGVVSRVVLAMAISVIVFVVILMLDKLADMESTGEVADGAIITLIYALATLVGFAFEQSFDGAVEALADMVFPKQIVLAETVLAICVCTIVYPAWRKYILRTLFTIKEAQEERKHHE